MNVFSSESGGGSFIARVYKSGDLSQESSIDVQTFALSGISYYDDTVYN